MEDDKMKGLYFILFCLFTFGAVTTMLNSSGIMPIALPTQSQAEVSGTQITDLTNTTKGNVNPLFELSFLAVLVGSVLSGLLAMLTIIPLLLSFGIPLYIAAAIQTPIWLIELSGVIYLLSGRDLEN